MRHHDASALFYTACLFALILFLSLLLIGYVFANSIGILIA